MMKLFIISLLYSIAINMGFILAASLLDIVLAAFFLLEISPLCFAVAGIFSGLFCYSVAVEKTAKGNQKQVSLCSLIMLSVVSGLLFFPIAPLSGSEYNLSFKCFAIGQLFTIIFLWKEKFYLNV